MTFAEFRDYLDRMADAYPGRDGWPVLLDVPGQPAMPVHGAGFADCPSDADYPHWVFVRAVGGSTRQPGEVL